MNTETEFSSLQRSEPDEFGHFGPYGGTYVSETLIHALDELKEAYGRWRKDEEFMARLDALGWSPEAAMELLLQKVREFSSNELFLQSLQLK